MIIEPLQQFTSTSNGILVAWDYSGTADVTQFSVMRASAGYQNDIANYTEVGVVAYPDTYYIDTTGTYSDYYIIVETDSTTPTPVTKYTHPFIYGEECLLVSDIYWELSQFLNLRCYRDRVYFDTDDRTKGRVAMGLWNKMPRPKVEITFGSSDTTEGYKIIDRITDGNPLSTTGVTGGDYPDGLRYDVDYNGNLSFYDGAGDAVAIQPYDEIWASYNFRAISTKNINACLNQALHGILVQPGVNKGYSSIASVPTRWDRAIIAGAAAFLLRQLAMQLMVPEPAIFFAMDLRDPESTFNQVNDRFDKINGKSKEYLEEYWKWCETIRIEKYPQVLGITTPEFQLPGGRTRYTRMMFKSG